MLCFSARSNDNKILSIFRRSFERDSCQFQDVQEKLKKKLEKSIEEQKDFNWKIDNWNRLYSSQEWKTDNPYKSKKLKNVLNEVNSLHPEIEANKEKNVR